MKFAVYGTLRKGYGNNRLLENTNYLGQGWSVDKFRLTANGIPYVSKKDPVSRVKVEIYETEDQNVIRNVDSLEGHPRFYKREEILVEMNTGQIEKAELYFCEGREHLTLIDTGDYGDYRSGR